MQNGRAMIRTRAHLKERADLDISMLPLTTAGI